MRILLLISLLLNNINIGQNSHKLSHAITQRSKIECLGIDVSFYQKDIDWENLDTTVKFVICKATEGIDIIDSKFSNNWEKTKIYKGAYHFFRPQFSGKKQAELFLKTVPIKESNIRPVIDVELTTTWKRQNIDTSIKHLNEMIDEIYIKTGIIPIIYTSPVFWKTYLKDKFSDEDCHLLWIADYRKLKTPEVPNDFKNWTIYQYSPKGKIKGIQGFVDLNICNDLDTILIK